MYCAPLFACIKLAGKKVMSWFTELLSFLSPFSKKSVQTKSSVSSTRLREPYTAGGYLVFYNIDTVFNYETFARKSLLTGEFLHICDFLEKEEDLAYLANVDYRFADFAEAYFAFCELEQSNRIDETNFLLMLNSLVIMFNKQYSSITVLRSRTFINDYPKYFRVIKCMLLYNLPVLIKADLYRQVSMFKKCVELLNDTSFDTAYERELRDEIRFRACNNIRSPFMICDVDELRAYSDDPERPHSLDWFFDVHYSFTLGRSICRTVRGDGNWAMATR